MKKQSIVHIIDILNAGGAERVLITLANLQYKHGHSVKVVTTVKEGPLKEQLTEGIEFCCLHRQWKWNPLTMYRLIKTIKAFEVVHVHSSYNLRYVFLAGIIFHLKNTLYFHEHFGDIQIKQKAYWHQRFIYPKTIFIGVSQQLADWAIEQVKVPVKKVYVLPNTIIQQEALTICTKAGAAIKILVISNFRPTKNLIFAITTFEKLQKHNPDNFHLTIIGKVADEDYFQSILKIIKNKGLQTKITMVIDCDNVQPIIKQFTLAIHTAFSESGPLVLIEYLAHNIPFVSYNTGEVAVQIKDDLPECIIDSFDLDEWLIKIEYLLKENNNALKLKLQGVFEKYFSAETYYHKCISIYETGLANKHSK